MTKGAIISECGNYRYQLCRIWNENKPKVLFIMLNPSTADGNKDDATIRRCINFAKSWDYGGLYVGNLFAYRATNPRKLIGDFDVVGKENGYHLSTMNEKCSIAVCAWGHSKIIEKIQFPALYLPLSNIKIPLYYLDLNNDGTPKHPLYLKSDLKPKKYLHQ